MYVKRCLCLLALLSLGCRSPLLDLRPPTVGGWALNVPPSVVEDHSRTLKRLRDIAPDEPNTPEARRAALAAHGSYLDEAFGRRAAAAGIRLDSDASHHLELRVTTLGEVRTKYVVYGILSGVAWGVGTGLLTHNTRLAVALGGYELLEETVFWIAGSSLFGRFSAPVVLEATLQATGAPKPAWTATYYVIWGGKRLQDFPEAARKDRAVQLHASLERALDQLFEDLALLPGLQGPPPTQLPPTAGR
jgi:hypothetical protein